MSSLPPVPARTVPTRRTGSPRRARLALAAVPSAVLLVLAGCGDDGSSGDGASASPSASTSASPGAAPSAAPSVVSGDAGVKATGAFGEKPTLTVPDGEPPQEVTLQVLSEGDGPEVTQGQTLVVNYLGQTWEPKDGAPNVFDNSYDRGSPTGFPIGVGRVISGWDATLVGQRVGSRVLMVIPPAQAYGTDPNGHELGGQTLIFVVDLVGALAQDAVADGAAAGPLPSGYPTVDSQPGKQPTITSVSGVKVPQEPASALLLNGGGAPLEKGRLLALQIVQTDTATGKETQSTYSSGPQLVPADQVFQVTTAFEGAKVGSRAVTITPAQDSGSGSVIAVIDVVAQY